MSRGSAHRVAKAGVADPVGAVGPDRRIAALQLVRPLRTGLDPGEAVARSRSRWPDSSTPRSAGSGTPRGSPKAAVERVVSPAGSAARGHHAPVAAGRHQHDAVGQPLGQHLEEGGWSGRRCPSACRRWRDRTDGTPPARRGSGAAPCRVAMSMPASATSRRSRRIILRLALRSVSRKSSNEP